MAVKNLVSGVLAQSITTSTTNVLVNIAENVDSSGIQSFFPTPPFYITIMPKSPTIGVANRLDSEILRVTAVGSDQSGNASLTCVRGQRDTTAKAFSAGDIVTVGIYADDAVFLGGEGSAVGTPAPWVDTSDIKNGAITTNKIPNGAVSNDKIDWGSTSRPIYYRGKDWAKSWTFNYDAYHPQLIFVAWEYSTAMFARIWDNIYKVFQNGGNTVTSSIDKTNHTWTLSTSNTGVVNVLELRNTKTGE